MKNAAAIALILLALFVWAAVPAFAQKAGDENPFSAWKNWKSIEPAIALRDLDGPEDIVEKAEIIEDRIDELTREKARLEKQAASADQKIQTLSNQRQVLQDLADVQMGGDTQTRQRLQDLAERIRREKGLQRLRKGTIRELKSELSRMINLAGKYREKAREIKVKEGGAQ
jgi:chromosome segregation ATPase